MVFGDAVPGVISIETGTRLGEDSDGETTPINNLKCKAEEKLPTRFWSTPLAFPLFVEYCSLLTGMKNGKKEIPHACNDLIDRDSVFISELS